MFHARAWHCMPALQSLKARVSHMISKWVTMRESALVRRYFTVWQRHPHPAVDRLAPACTTLVPPPSAPTAHYASSRTHDRGQGRGPAELSGFRVLSELRHQTDTAELEELQAQHTAEVRSSAHE